MTPEESSKIDTELLLKMITRTDSYLNYANTKSTIIVTFITAIIAAIGAHSGDVIHYLHIKNYPALIILFKILIFIGLLLLVTGFYHAGKSVMPYTRPSVKKNFFSFIDTVHHYSSEDAYAKDIQRMGKDDFAESMISLQYNLSAGLVAKYDMHRKAIYSILLSFIPLLVCILILLFV